MMSYFCYLALGALAFIGRLFIGFLQECGRFLLFFARSVSHIFRPPWYGKQWREQCLQIGFFSLPVVGLTAIFTGMVLAFQSYTGFARFSAENAIATVVVLSVTRELGPVLGGLMVAGRVGAAIAAEIGTMRVTEQVDALVTLSTHPLKYLVVPRLVAGALMLPLLVLVADVIGVLGGYLISVYKLGFNAGTYLQQTFRYLEIQDVLSGLIKAGVFGFLISLTGCYYGYYSNRGAAGVGRAATNAVVGASILILIMNYSLTALLFSK